MSERISRMGILVALAMIFSYIETLVPVIPGIPGIKLGIANIVIVFGLYVMPAGEVLSVSLARVLLMGLLFGNGAAMLYGLFGALAGFTGMYIAKRTGIFSVTGVSAAGGTLHNTGQLAAAYILIGNGSILYYLPVLLVSGVIAGTVTGVISGKILAAAECAGWM